MKVPVALEQVVVLEVAAQRGEELLDVLVGDLVVAFDYLLGQQVPVDDFTVSSIVRFVENPRPPSVPCVS
ncbi:hypothetical protein GRS80_00950 [Natrialba sp. INN-245]|nr:hypothetical protein [Natrialba sp. INN-245]